MSDPSSNPPATNSAPADPVTGKPFIIDEATRSLRLPDDPVFGNFNVEPVKIPVVHRHDG